MSKLGTSWRGVSLNTLVERIDTAASFAMVHEIGQGVQDTVTRLTGRPGRTFAQWARENADLLRA